MNYRWISRFSFKRPQNVRQFGISTINRYFSLIKNWTFNFSKSSKHRHRCRKHNGLYEYSYVCGPGHIPLLGLTIGQLLERSADKYGDNEAVVVVHQKIHKTFTQLLEEADQLAAGFRSLKLEKGDRLGIWGPNSYEWYLTQWAAARAGLVLVIFVKGTICSRKIFT